MTRINKYLQSLGLSDIEAKIYTGLLEHGASSVLELANHLNMKRITVHFNTQNLISKGLIAQTKHGTRRKLVVDNPERLMNILENQEKQIQSMKSDFSDVLKDMLQMIPESSKHNNDVDVVYYTGRDAIRSVYAEVLKSKEIRSYVNISQIYKNFPENPELFPKSVENNSLSLKEIIEDSPQSREYAKAQNPENYQFKFFPDTWDKSVFFDLMIVEGRIAIITMEKQGVFALLLKNKSVYLHTKFIFDMVWSILPEQDSKKFTSRAQPNT